MKYLIIIVLFVSGWCVDCQAQVKKAKKTAKTEATSTSTSSSLLPLTETDITAALKEALTKGALESAGLASALDGFYKNPKLFIPWPAETAKMKQTLTSLGMGKQVATVEETMNRAAEEAAKGAFDVFAAAIKGMTIKDGIAIVNGGETSATEYLRSSTSSTLSNKFKPIVKKAISNVKLTSYWKPLMTQYNKLPGVKKQNPDLEQYITNKTIDGLMILIAEQEIKIRKDPAAQVTDILKRVFGK
ncbi:MAG: DUF4197 domain-containing protein [Bacteroidales bacterium]|jgi:hypothetical protein|nr:DUF4197 domain-containing protein [Bacteroidales bacterium]